jgi:holo-[acyl-carrier protein] synthase
VLSVVTVVAGIDVQLIKEVQTSISHFGDRYLTRLYSEDELEECETNLEGRATSLAVRFAAKEAVIKVLRPDDHIPSWRTIEILLNTRSPTVRLSGEAFEIARLKGVQRINLSVSLTRHYAIAAVVADVAST